jgi:hypothetical protein
MRHIILVVIMLLGCAAVNAQSACEQTLAKCTARVQEWQDFYSTYKPYCDQLHEDNLALQSHSTNIERRVEILIAFGAAGAGIFAAFLIARGVKKAWPLSSQHKQLAMLVVGGMWIVGAALFAIDGSGAAVSLRELRVIVYSIPGVLFAGIGFWWFGRKIVVRLF